jgi:hypothetical protein
VSLLEDFKKKTPDLYFKKTLVPIQREKTLLRKAISPRELL